MKSLGESAERAKISKSPPFAAGFLGFIGVSLWFCREGVGVLES